MTNRCIKEIKPKDEDQAQLRYDDWTAIITSETHKFDG